MPPYVTPGVYFEAADRSGGGIATLRTDVAAFVGLAEKGPLDVPARVESWHQFRALFGHFLPNAYLAYAAKAFFENGGRRAWFVRVAAETVETVGEVGDGTSSPVESVRGFVAGAVVTASQGADLRRNHLLRDVDALARRLIFARPLEGDFDPLAPVHFAAGAAAARGRIRGEDGAPTLGVAAKSPGAWGNELEVRVSRASPAATVTAAVPQPLDGSASFVRSVVGLAPGAVVRLYQDRGAGREAWRVVRAVDPLRKSVAWDLPLGATFDLAGAAADPISLETLEFGLTVRRRGRVVEVFSGLSLVPEHESYVETATRDSPFIQVEDLQKELPSPSPFPRRLPDPAAPPGSPGRLPLQGGRDGLAAVEVRHLLGESGAREKRGLRSLEEVDEVAMVALPDVLIRPLPPRRTAPLPEPEPDPCLPCSEPEPATDSGAPPRLVEAAPEFALEEVFAVQQALVAHCEAQRDRVALLDPPLFSQGGEAVELGEVQAWRRRFDTSFAALYHPWVRVYDPLSPPFPPGRSLRAVPPSGHLAGVLARTDLAVGVHKAPANEELRWVQGVVSEVSAEEQGLLNPAGINCIRVFPGRGIRIYGARTTSSDTRWRYLSVRRLLLMIEEAVEEALQWTVFEPHDFQLRLEVRLAISSFLEGLWSRGALAGSIPAEAFFVKCDEENNPPAVIEAGRLLADVGVAPTVPAEFVVFRIGRTEEALEVREREASDRRGGVPWP